MRKQFGILVVSYEPQYVLCSLRHCIKKHKLHNKHNFKP